MSDPDRYCTKSRPYAPMHQTEHLELKRSNRVALTRGSLALVFLLLLSFALFLTMQGEGESTHADTPAPVSDVLSTDPYTLPACTLEDGSEQSLCLWDDGSGDTIVNVAYGNWTYNLTTGKITQY